MKNTQLSTVSWNPCAVFQLQFLSCILEMEKSWYYTWSDLICGIGRRCVPAHVRVYTHTHEHAHSWLTISCCSCLSSKHIFIITGVDRLDI